MDKQLANLIARRAAVAYHTDQAVALSATLAIDLYVDNPDMDEAIAGLVQQANHLLGKALEKLHDAGVMLAAVERTTERIDR